MDIRVDHFIHLDPAIEALMTSKLDQILAQGVTMMGQIQDLQTKVAELTAASAAREARDAEQDAVTAAQIQALKDQVASLQTVTTSGLGPDDVAALASAVDNINAVIASLNAADPTPPVVQ